MARNAACLFFVLIAGGFLSPCERPIRAEDSAGESSVVTLQGRCFSSSGKPIVGARVTLIGRDAGREPETLGTIFSGKHGAFTFENIKRQERMIVAVRASGHASKLHYLRDETMEDEFEVALETDPGKLSGVVTGPDGKPLEGVSVFTVSGFGAPIPGVMMDVTDENGQFVIHDIRKWEGDGRTGMYFSLSHPDFAKSRASYSSIPSNVNVQLDPPAVIEGQVIDELTGRPMPDVVVSAQSIGESYWHQTRTEKNGRYQLRTNADFFNIWAEAPDRIPVAAKAVEAVPGKRTSVGADIRMVRGGYVVGSIPEFKGLPENQRGRMRIAHYGPARPATGAAVTSTTVDDEGNFRLHVAPGRNYVYLMNGSASTYVHVGDGQDVEIALVPGERVDNDQRMADPDMMLARKLRLLALENRLAREAAKRDAERVPGQGSRIRRNSDVGRLLDKLEDRNLSVMFRAPWCQVMIEIAEIGPEAVPELIEELDATSDTRMMRCLGFLLRAIGDKRAVPALIRAIPKTLIPPASDMGLRSDDEKTVKFFQQHDLDAQTRENRFGFGRPVREVFGALQTLTGKKLGEQELFHVHRDGSERQIHLKERQFHGIATRWSKWWEANAAEYVEDKKYHRVNLPNFDDEPPAAVTDPDASYKTTGGGSNMMLQSIYDPNSRECFYDLDTGRYARLPKRWQGSKQGVDDKIEEIEAWAIGEGFDLMGMEVKGKNGTKDCFVIQPLMLDLWELPENRWKMRSDNITLAELRGEGRKTEKLVHFSKEEFADDLEGHAPFLFLTSDGTSGLVFLGIQVRDASLKPGGVSDGDDELRPIAFRKGRRFAVTELVPVD